jgi:hypothetical protein
LSRFTMKRYSHGLGFLSLALALCASAWTARGTVYFQNDGSLSGWSEQTLQQKGRIYTTSSPNYGSGTSLAFEQTWNNVLTGYHSEVLKATTQSNGQDRYYGKVIRLPSNWQFINANNTFQQFSPENPEGPWMLNWIQGNHLYIQTKNGTGNADLGTISANTWVRIVVRLKLATSGGAQEVWVNGTKKLSQTNIAITVPGTTLRWSNGIYCTAWRNAAPASGDQLVRTIYQDHFRVASSYSEADPSSW